jgi:hypothetical protein
MQALTEDLLGLAEQFLWALLILGTSQSSFTLLRSKFAQLWEDLMEQSLTMIRWLELTEFAQKSSKNSKSWLLRNQLFLISL